MAEDGGDRAEAGWMENYVDEVALYGSIIKNSEFDDAEVKEASLKFYIDCTLNIVTHLTHVLTDVVDRFFDNDIEPVGNRSKLASNDEKGAMKAKLLLVLDRFILTIFSVKMGEDVGSEKLKVTYTNLLKDSAIPAEVKLLLSLVMFDVNQEGWERHVTNMIDQNDTPFMLDVVAERLWHGVHTKFEPESRRAQISRVVDHITSKLGKVDDVRGGSRQRVDQAAHITQTRGRL